MHCPKMIMRNDIVVFLACTISILQLAVSSTSTTCNRSCGNSSKPVPFPFGFSSACQIQLNCSTMGHILLCEFPVRSIDSDSILVELQARCDRSIDTLHQLFNHNYAPTTRNGILLRKCSLPMSPCMTPTAMVKTNFQLLSCNSNINSTNCYAETTTEGNSFIQYDNVTRSGCKYLFSAILGGFSEVPRSSVDFQVVQVGWWLDGPCQCSQDANCTKLVSPANGRQAYRCQCRQGFIGDGYQAGLGCQKDSIHSSNFASEKWWIWLIRAIGGVLIILMSCSLCYLVQRKHRDEGKNKTEQEIILLELGASATHSTKSTKTKKLKRDGKKSHDLRFFSFESIASTTDNFATTNKLGEGGYGPVYKGKLHDGQEIAIKRLSRNSGQGLAEFKNELTLISKLQHTNLVRLIGCCIQREEKILIYEYMANKSLDFFLFDPMRKSLLEWKKRFNIIEGVAQGLLYLHKYSRFRIIHRDLKASNILLDDEMNPKISDFGMARIFEQNESEANTNRVVGTYGYMSPEYAMEGLFSMKSDVFSYGVMLLEIVSGRKNNSSYHAEYPLNLIGHAWELWREGRVLELMEPILADSYNNNEVLRCIQVGLLCVQDSPADRPTMSNVVSMITNETVPLSAPKQPAFFIGRSLLEADFAKHNLASCSLNGVSISEMEAR